MKRDLQDLKKTYGIVPLGDEHKTLMQETIKNEYEKNRTQDKGFILGIDGEIKHRVKLGDIYHGGKIIGKKYFIQGCDYELPRSYGMPVLEVRFNDPLEVSLKKIDELMVYEKRGQDLLTCAEVAGKYGVSKDGVKDNCARGALRCIKKGRTWLVDASNAERFYTKRKKRKR
jgi:hypothetical protein